jgi:hypothetical protein
MKNDKLSSLVNKSFAFLTEDFEFKQTYFKLKDAGCDIQYQNKTTGISIKYEYREAYIFIYLHGLINGRIEDIPRYISDDTILTGYGLDDIIFIRNSCALMKPAYAYGKDSEFYDEKIGMELYFKKFAQLLRDYASDVLRGDFSIFDKLDVIVKKRAREN